MVRAAQADRARQRSAWGRQSGQDGWGACAYSCCSAPLPTTTLFAPPSNKPILFAVATARLASTFSRWLQTGGRHQQGAAFPVFSRTLNPPAFHHLPTILPSSVGWTWLLNPPGACPERRPVIPPSGPWCPRRPQPRQSSLRIHLSQDPPPTDAPSWGHSTPRPSFLRTVLQTLSPQPPSLRIVLPSGPSPRTLLPSPPTLSPAPPHYAGLPKPWWARPRSLRTWSTQSSPSVHPRESQLRAPELRPRPTGPGPRPAPFGL